jgi:TRAP-type C4-dicarboxylate transport system permease small subunit
VTDAPDHEQANPRSDAQGAPTPPFAGPIASALIGIGSTAMLLAMATDAVAVIGRHAGFAFLGAIELFQMAAVVATSAAILLATLFGRHAAVHIVTEHVSPQTRLWLDRIGLLASAVAFALLCAGSFWVSIDLWDTSEITELLGIPLRWFRLVWIAAAGCAAMLLVTRFTGSFRR